MRVDDQLIDDFYASSLVYTKNKLVYIRRHKLKLSLKQKTKNKKKKKKKIPSSLKRNAMAEIVLGEAVLKYRWGTYNFMCYEKVFFFFFFSSIPEDKNLNIFLVLAENIFKKII